MKENNIFQHLNRLKKIIINNCDIIYSLLIVIYICTSIITTEFVYANMIPKLIFSLTRYGILFFCLLKIIFIDIKNYSKKEYIISFSLLMLLCLVTFITKNRALLQLFILILASYNVNFKKVMKSVLFFQSLFVLIIILGSIFGLLPNREYGRANNVIRYSLGFKFSTYSSLFIWALTTLYLYYRKDKLKIIEYILLFIVNLIFYIFTNTRMELFCSTIIIILFYLQQKGYLKIFYKFIGIVAKYLMIVLASLSLLLAITYNKENKIMYKLNIFTSGRLSLSKRGFENYGITLFGNHIKWTGLSQVYEGTAQKNEYDYVDCSYLNILYQYGIIILLLVIYAFYKLACKSVKEKDYYMQYILILLAFHSFINPQLLLISYNLFLLLLVDIILPSKEKGIKTNKNNRKKIVNKKYKNSVNKKGKEKLENEKL